jgi:hypothetical protein
MVIIQIVVIFTHSNMFFRENANLGAESARHQMHFNMTLVFPICSVFVTVFSITVPVVVKFHIREDVNIAVAFSRKLTETR